MAPGRSLLVAGLYQDNGIGPRYEARTVYLLHPDPARYLFEETHWWLAQVTHMADRILSTTCSTLGAVTPSTTSPSFIGLTSTSSASLPTRPCRNAQLLSRLIYDLSSAYLMTGSERYFLAARAAVDYMRDAFRSLSHDGEHCFWAYGRRRNEEGERGESFIFALQGPDDTGTIPLYEVYALAGLTQFYRITLDWELLEDITHTVNSFQDYFWDPPEAKEKGFAGAGGYYSHLDPATMRPDTPALGDNRSHKNWNSVGDHIPAYLINLILSLDPLPQGHARATLEGLLKRAIGIIEETSSLIVEKFPDGHSDYVNERFGA